MTIRRRHWLWGAVFLGLLALSLDYWSWDQPITLGPFGLPRWTMYFVALQLLLSAAITTLARTDWTGDPPGDGDGPTP